MEWFTADYHLSHKNIIRYVNRKFENIEQMDEYILSNLEDCVQKGDILFYLGDLTFKKEVAESFFNRFKKLEIHYLIGNHDNEKVLSVCKRHCKSVSYIKDIVIGDINITLCHYAMRVWNLSHLNAWQLYGHSHGTLRPKGKQYDVGVDCNEYKPVSFDFLKKFMETKGNNENYLFPEQRRS